MANIPLRLEAQNGSQIEEYRVSDGAVQVRTMRPLEKENETDWRELTAAQISAHVERNTVVAQWLKRRLGWRRLLRATFGQAPPPWSSQDDAHEAA